MKSLPHTRLLPAICAGVPASCADQPAPIKIPLSASLFPDHSASGRLFQEVNSYRRSRGTNAVQRHAGLGRLAQDHCEHLRQHRGTFSINGKNVSHIGFEGRALVAHERDEMENVSENVAAAHHAGANMPSVIVGLWKNSKDHHKNMLNAWTHSGMGITVNSDGMVFATQILATANNSQMVMRKRFNRF